MAFEPTQEIGTVAKITLVPRQEVSPKQLLELLKLAGPGGG